jgi:hypothetical protein
MTNFQLFEVLDATLGLRGLMPHIHLPALAGLVHGPDFANLSCLGQLSDLVDDFPKLSSGKADRKALTSILTVRMTKETEEVITAHGH